MHTWLIPKAVIPQLSIITVTWGIVWPCFGCTSSPLPQDPEIGVGQGVAGNLGFCTFQKLPKEVGPVILQVQEPWL